MGPPDNQLSKPRSVVRSRRRSKSRPPRQVEFHYEQFVWIRRYQCLYRARQSPRLTALSSRAQARDLTIEANITQANQCDPGAFETSFAPLRMTAFYFNKSGRFCFVRLIACSFRHFAI